MKIIAGSLAAAYSCEYASTIQVAPMELLIIEISIWL